MRYGLSFYSQEAPVIRYTNEWGAGESSVPLSHHTGHFLEITPGVRTEIFPGMTIGWNVYMRMLISAGAGKDLKPVWMPGYGMPPGYNNGSRILYLRLHPLQEDKVIVKPKQRRIGRGRRAWKDGIRHEHRQPSRSGSGGRL